MNVIGCHFFPHEGTEWRTFCFIGTSVSDPIFSDCPSMVKSCCLYSMGKGPVSLPVVLGHGSAMPTLEHEIWQLWQQSSAEVIWAPLCIVWRVRTVVFLSLAHHPVQVAGFTTLSLDLLSASVQLWFKALALFCRKHSCYMGLQGFSVSWLLENLTLYNCPQGPAGAWVLSWKCASPGRYSARTLTKVCWISDISAKHLNKLSFSI